MLVHIVGDYGSHVRHTIDTRHWTLLTDKFIATVNAGATVLHIRRL